VPLASLDCLIDCKFGVAGTALCAIFRGGVIPKDLVFLLDAYLELPGPNSARDLLAYAPDLAVVFEQSQPNGLFARIDDKAANIAKALLFGIKKAELIEGMGKAYEDFRESSTNLTLSPWEFTQDGARRLLFELMCYCVYITIGAVAGRVMPNDEIMLEVFHKRLCFYAGALLREIGCDCQCQIVIKSPTPKLKRDLGESVTFLERIDQYLTTKQDPHRSLELFALHVGAAIFLEDYAITSLIAGQYAVHAVELVGVVLDAMFLEPAWL